jgi:hypothetical protein
LFIDNSKASQFRECAWKYYEMNERNGTGIEPVPIEAEGYSSLDYGGRIHERLEEYYKGILKYPPHQNEILETEAEIMMQAYQARYPEALNNIIDVERTFKVQLPFYCPKCYNVVYKPNGAIGAWCDNCNQLVFPGEHTLIGKIDLVLETDGVIDIWDHKTEKRGAKSNLPQKWGARDQASLYLWAAERLYPAYKVGNFYVNVLTRQSEKGQIGPSFPAERQKLERNQRAIDIAIRDIVLVADEIERYKTIFKDGEWPSNREMCYGWGYCPYYQIHRYGEDPSLIIENRYQAKKEYLNFEGIPIIQ